MCSGTRLICLAHIAGGEIMTLFLQAASLKSKNDFIHAIEILRLFSTLGIRMATRSWLGHQQQCC